MKAGTKVLKKGWNVDDILTFLKDHHCPHVEKDNDGQIVLYTDLYEDEDGSLKVI